MDETQLNRVSDAAATRKRRSSILKSQRPPRTPFSELEFNVATPTDSAKSRRVSFSRRTGVAEFVTNEATTTWKNFYEEQNKSLESSGNESGSKQAVGHLEKRAFDQQFEEVEADFIGTLNTGPNINISSSFNNFEHQLAALECTDNIKLTAPLNHFELSAVTNNHTKLFNDLSIPRGEVTDRIDINFSTVQIGQTDDLDEIQNNLKLNFGNVPFQRQNISEYIEVDLNMTHAMASVDDMSITDTIHSPKVQDVSKNASKGNNWEVDIENIPVNPYAALRETENFAINEEPDKVLVFDGKRLTIQSEKVDKENYRQTLLPNDSVKPPQRKTIVFNVNDDLPNFINDPHHTSGFSGVSDLKRSLIDDMSITEPLQGIKQRTVLCDDLGNISVTQAISSNIIEEKRRTILFEGNDNISVTQGIPTNIMEKRRTVAFDDSNISITEAVPANVPHNVVPQTEKRRTIVFNDGDISMTQALPVNIIPDTRRRTIVYEDNAGNLSITQAVPKIVITEAKADKRRTIVYEDDTGNISVTQAIPSNIIIAENAADRRKTVVFESDTGNISVTQAVPSNLILQEQVNISKAKINTQIENARRRTIVYENDTGNLSITQAVPNQLIQGLATQNHMNQKQVIKEIANQNHLHHDTKVHVETNKRRTIVFDNDDADISVTQAVSLNQVICGIRNEQEKLRNNAIENIEKENKLESKAKQKQLNNTSDATKRRTVVFDNDDADISMTQVVSASVINSLNPCEANQAKTEARRRTVVFEDADISVTQPANINQLIPGFVLNVNDDLEAALNEALHNKDGGKCKRTIVFDKENANIPISQNLQGKDINISMSQSLKDNATDDAAKQRTVVLEDRNFFTTQLSNNILEANDVNTGSSQKKELHTSEMFDISMTDMNTDKDTTMNQNVKLIRQSLDPEQKPANFNTKPIPTIISIITNEREQKYLLKNTNNNPGMESNTNGVNNVLVYQTALTKRTEQGDSEVQQSIAIQNDEKLSSSSKIDKIETKQSNEMSSSSKTTSAIEAKELELTANDQEFQIQEKLSELNKEPVDEKQNDADFENQTDQSESAHDDHSIASDATSQMSKSILHDLLDMTSTEDVDKDQMAQVETKKSQISIVAKSCADSNSIDTLFYITKDPDVETQIQTETPQLTEHSPLPLEYKDEPELVVDIQNNLELLKETINNKNTTINRHYEKILSPDLDKTKEKVSKSFKTANDTNELLDMLSDLTDKTMTKRLDAHLEEDEEKPEPVLIKGHLALENKSESEPGPRPLSFAARRQSIVLSREDLLTSITMAGADLKFCLDFDSDLNDTETPEAKSPKRSVRLSNEVVKTLHFDDSISETSIHDAKRTPLKKTAFGETSYMQEHKAKVIPSYLKDVSDGIKELMDDLVKPNADVLPFDNQFGNNNRVRKVLSTCSTQIQANLITSSQIDIITEPHSNSDSVCDVEIKKISSVDMINDAVNRSVSRALKSPIKPAPATRVSIKSFDSKMDASIADIKTVIPVRPTGITPGRVLIFDPSNPLNNILLAPDAYTDVHKYNPANSTETIVSERSRSVQLSLNEKDKDYEAERVLTQYNVGNLMHSVKQSGDASSGKIEESQSFVSNLSKPMSIDQSTDAKLDVKHTEVNTVIAMKGNRELLDASSSLTLVDDALARSTFDVDIDSRTTTSQEDMSPVKVIYAVGRSALIDKLDSDFNSPDELEDRKPKKRNYSPAKRDKHKTCNVSSLDLTPKPTTKMQRLSESDSFKPIDISLSADKTDTEEKKKKPLRKAKKKPGTSITVQQLITEYNIGPIDHETLDEQIKNVLRDPKSDCSSIEPGQTASDLECTSLDMVSSFTSSKNLRDIGSPVTSQCSKVSRMDWQPDMVEGLNSTELVSECESSVNVVAKIDMLPFMGSHECEWESSSGDTWTFRLLHARLRLAVRLEHRHDNATRTRVRADTPVRAVQLDTLPHDSKNTLAALCVSFVAETMRYFISRGCACAGDVPALVRRCAAAARLAARWARAMHEARLHLAYALARDGLLTLKVANIPLRCVWEVSLRLELVVEDAREAPWVRAGDVRVRRVLPAPAPAPRAAPAPAPAPAPRLPLRNLPRDWSHAPRTIWRIFKYLKHKTRDDDEDLFLTLWNTK